MQVDGKKPTRSEKAIIDAFNKRMHEKTMENSLAETICRASSVTVGTAFGGTSEIGMRRPDGTVTFALLQPVEVIELIHQLAANVGCHIHIQPRKDFSSWRAWKHSEEELAHFRGDASRQDGGGWPPHFKADGNETQYQTSLPPPEQQPGLQPAMMARSKENEQTVADQKPVKRRSTKRAATPA
jgi:hypothetical protein